MKDAAVAFSVALISVLVFLCLGQIIDELKGIRTEMHRANTIECIRLDYEGVDSLGPRDLEACG